MNPKHSCYIENSPEMREWCLKNGITPFLHNKSLNDLGKYIKVFGTGLRVYSCSDIAKDVDGVDCLGNPALFQAVSAVRDDSDYMQWFVFDEDVYDMIDEHQRGDVLVAKKGEWYLCKDYKMISSKAHKASLSKLQERFKK